MQQHVDLAPEVVVAGRYRLVESLASGGTASVWRATDEQTGGDVALKALRDDGVDEGLLHRARREARVLEDLEHPNLVRVRDSGEDDGLPFMVMDLLEGEPLQRVLARRGRIPVDEAVRLVIDVAGGLGAAHDRGVIHRDVKPSNIVCHDEVPVLVDFGIARSVDATTLTRGLVVGTAAYLAPEQAQGLPLTPACDVYALGCVLYELLTGRPPFQGDSSVAIALKHVQEEPVPPCDRADVPAAVNAVVVRCLAKDPAARPQTGAALAAELRTAIDHEADGDDTLSLAAVRPPADGTTVMPAIDLDHDLIDGSPLVPPVAPPPARRRGTPSYGVLLLLLLAALLLFGMARLVAGADGVDPRPVPDVTNAPVTDAIRYLEGAGMSVDVEQVPSDAEAGTVVATEPVAGTLIPGDGTVTLSVSTGPGDSSSGGGDDDDGGGGGDDGGGDDDGDEGRGKEGRGRGKGHD